jgi:hypothetical protein
MIHGYKGYDKDLRCRGHQYEVGKEYETDKPPVRCGSNGFHLCEFPLDVFGYYPPADSRYTEADGDGQVDKCSEDSKVAVQKIRIGAEIGIGGLIKAGVEFIMGKVDWANNKECNNGVQSAATNTGDRSAATNTGAQSAATNTGDQSAATNTGNYSAATNTGYQSAATNTGNYSAATNTGNYSAATNTGYRSAATNTGDQSAATNTGNYSAATNTGDQSAATNTGDQSAATVEGKESVAMATGYESKAKGALGCWIVLAEWEEREDGFHVKDVQCARVDGEKVKADTFYQLKGGEFVEVNYIRT